MKKHTSYKATTDFLFSQLPMYQRIGKSAYKANLNNTLKLDQHLNHPHRHYKTIHVAGTNGKGSVSHMLASVLMESGLKVGLYTSPHLKDFRERIRVNQETISEDEVVAFVNNNIEIIDELKPSFFELTVAMAFDHFAQQKIDIAVIEVGLGGRLDSTNIIRPDLAIITNIGLDHTQFLGTTLPEIAREKGGIIKPNTPVVIGETQPETIQTFKSIAKENKSLLIEASKSYSAPYSTRSITNQQIFQIYKGDIVAYRDLACDLLGIYQQKNICTALTAIDQLKELGYNIENSSIYNGIKNVKGNTSLIGRWHILEHNPIVVCDIAHNYDGLKEVIDQISNTPHKALHIIIGMVNDKDTEKILNLLPKHAHYYFTKANIPRSMSEYDLEKIGGLAELKGSSYPNVQAALKKAKKNASSNDLIFIGGSTFVVSEIV